MATGVRLAIGLLATLLVACSAARDDGAATASCEPLREFHVVGHGWHSGIVVDGRDLEARLPALGAHLGAAPLVELGWGDAAFYRAPQPTLSLALRAVLFPSTAVLHIVAIPTHDLHGYFPASTLLTLSVPASGYERLLDHLVQTFERSADGHPLALEPGLYGASRFYRATGSFHALNTCNTWVARAVAATGAPIRNAGVVTADGLLDELRAATGSACHAVREPARGRTNLSR